MPSARIRGPFCIYPTWSWSSYILFQLGTFCEMREHIVISLCFGIVDSHFALQKCFSLLWHEGLHPLWFRPREISCLLQGFLPCIFSVGNIFEQVLLCRVSLPLRKTGAMLNKFFVFCSPRGERHFRCSIQHYSSFS